MRGQSYYEICEHWPIEDVADANAVLDAIEMVQAQQRAKAESNR